MYDYLIVGVGLFGAVFGREMAKAGKKVLIIDKNNHIGGNTFTEPNNGIEIHVFGPHLFHTNSLDIWTYITQFGEFNHYQHRVKAVKDSKMYSLPFNMNTFNQLWGVLTPEDAKREITKQKMCIENPANLEEWALSQVGGDIYHTLIYGYTKKQWRRSPKDLPAFIIQRLPLRFTYDDNYFNDRYQGVPVKGYRHLVENIVDGIDVKLNTEFADTNWRAIARQLVYSGPIDAFFDYEFGELEYRTLRFDHQVIDGNHQGVGQLNYTDENVPYTRIIEHKHFYFQECQKSVITFEYPEDWTKEAIPYYPVNDEVNNSLFAKYKEKSKYLDDVIIGGRLGNYRYYDMHQVIGSALTAARHELGS